MTRIKYIIRARVDVQLHFKTIHFMLCLLIGFRFVNYVCIIYQRTTQLVNMFEAAFKVRFFVLFKVFFRQNMRIILFSLVYRGALLIRVMQLCIVTCHRSPI